MIDAIISGFVAGTIMAMTNAVFTWIANKTVVKKLDQLEQTFKRYKSKDNNGT